MARYCLGLVREQGADVVRQMRNKGLRARTVRLKLRLVRFHDVHATAIPAPPHRR